MASERIFSRRGFLSVLAGTAGLLYFQRTSDSRTSLDRYDLTARRAETLLPEVGTYTLSADGILASDLQSLADRSWLAF